jgi:hypothetical protein
MQIKEIRQWQLKGVKEQQHTTKMEIWELKN